MLSEKIITKNNSLFNPNFHLVITEHKNLNFHNTNCSLINSVLSIDTSYIIHNLNTIKTSKKTPVKKPAVCVSKSINTYENDKTKYNIDNTYLCLNTENLTTIRSLKHNINIRRKQGLADECKIEFLNNYIKIFNLNTDGYLQLPYNYDTTPLQSNLFTIKENALHFLFSESKLTKNTRVYISKEHLEIIVVSNVNMYKINLKKEDFENFTYVNYKHSCESDTYNLSKDLTNALIEVIDYIAKDDVRLYLKGAYFEITKEGMVSIAGTNSYTLYEFKEQTDIRLKEDIKVILCLSEIQNILTKFFKNCNSQIKCTKNKFELINVDKNIVVTGFCIDSDYPNYKTIIPHSNENKLIIKDYDNFINKLQALNTDVHKTIYLDITKNNIELMGKNKDVISIQDFDNMELLNDFNLKLGLNRNYLLNSLAVMKKYDYSIIELANANSPIKIHNNKNTTIILIPIRI